MARTQKKPRIAEFNRYENCFGEYATHDGTWQDYLGNDKPLVLELGCGKAELSMELARQNKDKNYIGVDIKSDRLWRPATNALAEKLTNIAFIQSDIRKLTEFFEAGAVDEIWITFPDPYPKNGQAKHRMTNKTFLDVYHKLLNKNGVVKFKTDDETLFDYSLECFSEHKGLIVDEIIRDIYAHETNDEIIIQTTYEKKWLSMGRKVYFTRFHFA